MSLLDRFEAKYIPEPNSGCWLWTAYLNEHGYGKLRVDGRSMNAQRVSWELHRDPVPDGVLVCHKCDVRCCVNPEHLFLGTDADNHGDMKRKGRGVYWSGEKNGFSKLSNAEVSAIRQDSRPIRKIAPDYRISFSQVARIKARRFWKDI